MKKKIGLLVAFGVIVSLILGAWQGLLYPPHEDCMSVKAKVEAGKWFLTENLLVAVPLEELASIVNNGNWRSALQQYFGLDQQFGYFGLHQKCNSYGNRGYAPVKQWHGERLPNSQFATLDQNPTPQWPQQFPQFPLVMIAAIIIGSLSLVLGVRRWQLATAR